MKHIKMFEKFNSSDGYKILGSFTNDDFDEFNEMVKSWCEKNEKVCRWDICYVIFGKDHGSFTSYAQTKRYWDMYVKHGYRMVLVESNDDLFGVCIDIDGKVKNCVNSDDVNVTGEVKDSIQSFINDELFSNY